MRIYSSMGLLVYLIIECAKDIYSFLLFLFFWVIVMSAMMVALDADYDDSSYPDLSKFIRILLQTWRNSLGDEEAPLYLKWSTKANEDDDIQRAYGFFMIAFIWFVWFVNTLFILIILLNFLIAIISQSYEKVMQR